MTIYVPGKVTLRQTWQPMDPDAAAYITAVEAADGQALEEKVKIAIDNFVLGCKADGIWSAIKASCILAGARTLSGALVPLVGTAPTNYNFVAGDYDRETGLKGDGSTKYLDSNRAANVDPQNSRHLAVFATFIEAGRLNPAFIGSRQETFNGRSFLTAANLLTPKGIESSLGNSSPTSTSLESDLATGLIAASRNSSSSYSVRFNQTNTTINQPSEALSTSTTFVFARPGGIPDNESAHRLAFYSIGESLDLARLDARVTDLINAIGVAIP